MRGDDQVAVTRMDQDVISPDGRIVVHELLPATASVQRDKQTELRASEKQIQVFGILAHHLNIARRRQGSGNVLEGLAVVMGDENVWLEIVTAVTVNSDVCRRRVEV